MKKSPIAAAMVVSILSGNAMADDTDARIQRLEAEIADLKESVEATAEAVDSQTSSGLSIGHRTTIGGYGELHYNNWESISGNVDKKELDFHRFVLTIGHEFNNKVRFFSEIELEHSIAGEGKNGEIELEQAYIEFDYARGQSALGGLFLMPVGIINETHEPPTFYGVERNPVEKYIVPATWWEGGAMAHGNFGKTGLSYNAAVSSGLNLYDDTDPTAMKPIRSGRQKVSEAVANDLAYTGRLKWTGVRGLELAGSAVYQTNMAQGLNPGIGAGLLLEAHARYTISGFTITGLYAQWNIDGDVPKNTGQDKQNGYYLEASYQFNPQWGIYGRYNEWDTQAGASGNQITKSEAGVNYWPIKQVVIKADAFTESGGDNISEDKIYKGFNLGIGYMF